MMAERSVDLFKENIWDIATLRYRMVEAGSAGGLDLMRHYIKHRCFEERLLFNEENHEKPHKNYFHPTPLSNAAESGHLDVVEELAPYYMNASSHASGYPLHIAASKGDIDCVAALITFLPHMVTDRDVYKCSPIEIAEKQSAENSRENPTAFDMDHYTPTPLSEAVRNGHLHVVKELAPFYINVSVFDFGYALHIAASNGDLDCVQALIESVPQMVKDQDWYGDYPSEMAKRNGHDKIAEVLSEAEKRNEANNVLHEACRNGDIERVKSIVKSSPDQVNEFGYKGFLPIQLAAREGHSQIAEILLRETGAEVDKTRDVERSDTHLARYQMSSKRSVKIRTTVHYDTFPSSYTALCIAARLGRSDMVELLLSHGANPKLEKFKKGCPLSLAAAEERTAVVKILSEVVPIDGIYGKRAVEFRSRAPGPKSSCLIFLLENGALHDVVEYDTLRLVWNIIVKNCQDPTVRIDLSIRALIEHKFALKALATERTELLRQVLLDTNGEVMEQLITAGIFEIRYHQQNLPSFDSNVPQMMRDDMKALVPRLMGTGYPPSAWLRETTEAFDSFWNYSSSPVDISEEIGETTYQGFVEIRRQKYHKTRQKFTKPVLLIRRFYESWFEGKDLLLDCNTKLLSLTSICRRTVRSEIANTQGYISKSHILQLGVPEPVQKYLLLLRHNL